MNLYKKYKLGELGKIITGKTPSSKFPQHFGDDMPFITPSDFGSYSKSASSAERYISIDGAAAHQNKILPENSVLVTCIGSDMGKVVVNKTPCLTNQQINSIIPNREIIDYNFLYYSIINKYDLLRSIASDGTTMPIVNKTDFENIEIEAPSDLPTQTRIASILSALDDKIELNRRTNHTLEQMAQTLFKKYFVADIDSENLPEGWSRTEIGNIIAVKDGTHDSPKPKDSGCFLITSKHIKGSKIDFAQAYYISETDYIEINKRSKVDTYDILITMIGTVGVLHLVLEDKIDFAIKNIGLFKSSNRTDLFEYLYLYLNSSFIKEYLEARTSGSTQQYLTLDTLRNIPVVIPSDNVITEFKKLVNPIIMQIKTNDNESLSLSKLRDTLLPKLMSGEINVN